MDDVNVAKVLIHCLDLTSLGDNDTEYKIEDLCRKAFTPYGNVAAICVYPKFVPLVKKLTNKSGVKTATVVNFPYGEYNLEKTIRETFDALEAGADEIDAVFPYKNFLDKDFEACDAFLKEVRAAVGKKKALKVILETGEMQKASHIINASKMCIQNGVDFIKTSTGKTKVSATPDRKSVG